MGAGESLRAAALKIAQKVQGSDEDVSLCVDRVATYSTATQPKGAAAAETLADFGQSCAVRNLSVGKATALLGTFEAGDREIVVPAASVTKEQLSTHGAYVLYGDERLTLMRYDPTIDFGVVTEWRLVCRLKGKALVP